MSRAIGLGGRAAPPSSQPPARLVRGLLAGLITGGGAVVAHAVAGGQSTPGTAAAVTLLAMVAGLALSHWHIGWCSALGLAAAAQGSSHLLMSASMGSAHHANMSAAADQHAVSTSMLLAHLVVVLVTTVLARGADRVVRDALRAVVARFIPPTWRARPPLATPRPVHRTDVGLLPGPLRVSAAPASRRGPPALTRLSIPTP